MRNVKTQIEKVVGTTLRYSTRGTIKNIDAYVREARVTRTSLNIIDPATGKRVKIIYNNFSFEVPNSKKYLKLYAYVFPNQLNSYQESVVKMGNSITH